jgi:D-alanyl-D-alanine carboxypeptidase/D-alanyl-D-alanine-endopeptidase (penicillin-binding protein 4)
MKGLGIILAITGLNLSTSYSAEAGAICYANLKEPRKIEGLNVNERLAIASVSKLMTSHWLVAEKGLQYRFRTVLSIRKNTDGTHDIHVQGSRDPYFGAEKMHFVISELNKRKITNVKTMSFDEDFKFFWFADDPESNRQVAVGHYVNPDPDYDTVIKQLRAYSKLTQGYEETQAKAKARGLAMFDKPEFKVESFEFKSKKDFVPEANDDLFSIASQDSGDLLKEMNRNSNNHAANQIFEHLGSQKQYQKFIEQKLNLKSSDIVMLNGSGDRVDTAQGARYNEATCEATLKIIMDLHNRMVNQKSSLAKIATVIGTNSGSATQLYNNDMTHDSVIAKTGTVNPAVTLGGVASTQKGLVFFMFIVDPDGNFSQARQKIRFHLVSLIERNGGPKLINGRSFSFFSADHQSFSPLDLKQESQP